MKHVMALALSFVFITSALAAPAPQGSAAALRRAQGRRLTAQHAARCRVA